MADDNKQQQQQQQPTTPSLLTVRAFELAPSSVKPAPRGGATLTHVPDAGAVFLVGGANRNALSFGDVYRLDLASRSWSFVRATGGALLAPRSGHSTVAFAHQLVVFGGLDASSGAVLDDVQVFDTRTAQWWTPRIDGDRPAPRNAHAAIRIARDRMLVFGGSSPFAGAMDDLFVLHLPKDDDEPRSTPWRWQRIACAGERPTARELHVACWLQPAPPRGVCFLGGRGRDGALCDDIAVLDIERWTWTLQRAASRDVTWWQRCAHVAGVIGRQLVSVGGWDGTEISSECFALPLRDSHGKESDVATATARVVQDKEQGNQARLGRFGHCACVVSMAAKAEEPETQQEEGDSDNGDADAATAAALLVFGGMNADDDLQDLVVIAPVDVAL